MEILDGLKNWDLIWREADPNKKRSIANLMTIKVLTGYKKGQYKGKAYENKHLKITYTPEIDELFMIGLLETDKEINKENAKMEFFNSPNLGNRCSDH